jgi:biopolymer transport protein ExbD
MSSFSLTPDSPYAGLFPKQARHADAEFDITAMIDLVFMMNIYFLVTFLAAALGEINLPTATHVAALDADDAVILTVIGSLDGESVSVYLGSGTEGVPVTDADEQQERIHEWAEQGIAAGKKSVLIKAEKKVRLRDLFRISSAAAIEGMKLHVAVMETEGPA